MTKKLSFTTLLIINGLIAIMFFVILQARLDSNLSSTAAETTSNVFFTLQLGQSSPIYSIIMFTIVTIYSNFIWIYSKNNVSFFNVIQRIGYRKFLKKGFTYSFLGGAGMSLLMSLYQVVLLTFLIHPLQFSSTSNLSDGISVFDNGNLWAIIQFSILAALGWGIYSVFVFSVALWIKKNVLAIVSGGLIGVLLFLLPALFAQILPGTGSMIFYPLQISTLVAPGVVPYPAIPLKQSVSYFPYSVLIYLLLSILLMILWIKKKEKKN